MSSDILTDIDSLTSAALTPCRLLSITSLTQVPRGLDARSSSAVRAAIDHAFVFGFRLIMLFCAGLAVASAAVASRMIRPGAAA